MARTLDQLEIATSKVIGDYVSGTATGGAASKLTATTTSTDVMVRPAASWVAYFLHMTSGSSINDVRQINDFAIASEVGTLTVDNSFTAQIANAETFRIHALPLSWKYEAIDQALGSSLDLFPRIVVEEFLSGELLRNAKLEQWRNNTPYDWTTESGTITKETTTVYQGAASMKLAASSEARQRISLEHELSGLTLSLTGYLYGKKTNGPVLRITIGSTDNDSSAVAADDTWEQITKTASVSNAVDPIYISLVNGSGGVAYFDDLHLYASSYTTTRVLPVSDAFVDVRQLWSRSTTVTPTTLPFDTATRLPPMIHNGYARFNHTLKIDYPVRLVGTGVWDTVSAATDSIDLDWEQEHMVAVRAGIILMDKAIGQEHLGSGNRWREIKKNLQQEEARLTSTLARSQPTKHLALPVR